MSLAKGTDMSPPQISSCLFHHLEKAVETQGLNILKVSLCRPQLGTQQAGEWRARGGAASPACCPVTRCCHLLHYLIECALKAYSMPHKVIGF